MDQLRTARRLRAFGFALCAALLPALAAAQAWPSKPVKIIVGYPPGGGTNTVARLLAEHLSKSLGQQVVVENRPGAGGRIATLSVARSDPDGYTLMFASDAELTIAQVTVKAMPYDPLKDLAPVALAGRGPYILVTHAGFAPRPTRARSTSGRSARAARTT